jgi:light-regulated signal transduction histidine kinase (bacteriophytochrome)
VTDRSRFRTVIPPATPTDDRRNGHFAALLMSPIVHIPRDAGIDFASAYCGWLPVSFRRGKEGAGEGAGLGLAIVKEIMKMHGGSVAVENSPAGGVVFTLHFVGALPS